MATMAHFMSDVFYHNEKKKEAFFWISKVF